MQENRATAIFAARAYVVIEHDHEIIEAIRAPEFFMGRPARQSHTPVVGGALRIVAPAIAWPHGPHRQRPCPAQNNVRPEKAIEEAKVSRRRRLVAFRLGVAYPGAPERAANNERPGVQSATRELLRLSQARQRGRHEPAQATLGLASPASRCVCQFFCDKFHASLYFCLTEGDSFARRKWSVFALFNAV
jgi:hypothetical protein